MHTSRGPHEYNLIRFRHTLRKLEQGVPLSQALGKLSDRTLRRWVKRGKHEPRYAWIRQRYLDARAQHCTTLCTLCNDPTPDPMWVKEDIGGQEVSLPFHPGCAEEWQKEEDWF